MTLDEARMLLGIDAAATPDEARRAYLRLVKKHRPEQDPAGFQRVRAAYDLVRQLPPFFFDGAVVLSSSVPSSSVPSSAEVASVPGADEPVHENVSVTSDDRSLQRFRERAAALDDSDTRGAIKLWRTAVREHPESAEARWALLQAYDEAGDEERVGRVLLKGYRRGLEGFGPELLARVPRRAPAELFERAKHNRDLALAAAMGLARHVDVSAALPYLRIVLATGPGDSFRIPALVIETLGRLGERGEVGRFRKLAARFESYVKDNDIALWGPHAAEWLVLRELSGVARKLPSSVFSALADSVRTGDATSLSDELELYAERNPAQAKRAQQTLKAQAPALFDAYGALLQRRQRFRVGWAPFLVVALFGLRALVPATAHLTVTPPEPTPSGSAAPVPPSPHDFRAIYHQNVYRAIDRLEGLAREKRLYELEVRVLALGEACPGGCPALAREMDAVVRLTRNQDPAMIAEVKALWFEFERVCPVKASMVREP